MAVPLVAGLIVVVVVGGSDYFFDPFGNPWGTPLSTRVSTALTDTGAQLAILNYVESDSGILDVLGSDLVNFTATVTVKTLVDRSGADEVKAAVAALFIAAGAQVQSSGVSDVNSQPTGEPVPTVSGSWLDNALGGITGFVGNLGAHLELVIGLVVLLALAAVVFASSSHGSKLLRSFV